MVYLFIYLCLFCVRKTRRYKNATEKFLAHRAVLFLHKHFSNLELYREMQQRARGRVRTVTNARGNNGVYGDLADNGEVLTESMILLNRAEEVNTYRPKVTKSTVFEAHGTSGVADVQCRYGTNETNDK